MNQNKTGGKPSLREIFDPSSIFNVKSTITLGMFVALSFALTFADIYLTPSQKLVSFSYLPGAVGSYLFGPLPMLVYGFVCDFVTFLSNPKWGYFFGYAISEMLMYFIYACFLYKRPLKIWRVAAARAVIIVLVFFGLGYLWSYMMYGSSAAKFFTGTRLAINLITYPFHVVLTYFVVKYAGNAWQKISR